MAKQGKMRCFVGDKLDETETCEEPLMPFSQLYTLDREACLFSAHLEAPQTEHELYVCTYHGKVRQRLTREQFCCNPFKKHVTKVRREKEITVEMAKTLWSTNILVNPGQGLCKKCFTQANKIAGTKPIFESVLPVNEERPSCSGLQKQHGPEASTSEELPRTPRRGDGDKLLKIQKQVDQSPDFFEESSSDSEKANTGSSLPSCIVGFLYRDPCTRLQETVSEDEREMLSVVLKLEVPQDAVLCSGHRRRVVKMRQDSERLCVNPFTAHGERKAQKHAQVEWVKACRKAGFIVNILDGLCKECFSKGNTLIEETSEERDILSESTSDADIPGSQGPSQSSSDLSGMTFSQRAQIDVNNILKASGLPLLHLSNWHERDKIEYDTQKTREVSEKFRTLVCKALDLEKDEVQILPSMEVKAQQFDQLFNDLKLKMENATYNEKLTILTLVPDSWSVHEVAAKFGVTKFMVKKAKRIKKSKGILCDLEKKRGRPTNPEVLQKVEDFYNHPEYSRECPGMKQQVSMGKGVYKTKRLLLGNIGELYNAFKSLHPNIKFGRTMFSILRPKYCVLPGAAGTHSVCVCKYHENMKLLLSAIDADFSYQDAIQKVVCDPNKRECMLRTCKKCPKRSEVYEVVIGMVRKSLNRDLSSAEEYDELGESESEEDFMADEFNIKYKQWSSTDRPNLDIRESTLPEFSEIFTDQLLELIPHSYVTKQQAQYLKSCKEQLSEQEVIVLMDFAENYNYTVQEEVQSHYFSKGSCSIHPVELYFRENGETKAQSLCIISEDLRHDVGFVDAVQAEIIQYIKEKLPSTKKLHYFTDGCAAQYKNCKSFLNLCKHKEKYDLVATWSFFATSHGKSPCDRIGGAVKKSDRIESLTRLKSTEKPINNINELFSFCKQRESSGSKVKHILLKKEDIDQKRTLLSTENPKTIAGTRSFHSFTPISKTVIGCKRLGFDQNYTLVFDFSGKSSTLEIQEGSFICCAVERAWKLAIVKKVDFEETGAEVTFCSELSDKKKTYDLCDTSSHFLTFPEILCNAEVNIDDDCIVLKTSKVLINKLLREFIKICNDLLKV